MTAISKMLVCSLLLPLAFTGTFASARTPVGFLQAVNVDGLHLGMSAAEVEQVIKARADFDEPGGRVQSSYDCDDLASGGSGGTYDDSELRYPKSYSFGAYEKHEYHASLEALPTMVQVSSFAYSEWHRGDWPSYLAAAEARYGKADEVQQVKEPDYASMVAVWCEEGERQCRPDGDTERPSLTLRLYPGRSDNRDDRLSFEFDEGRAVGVARNEHYFGLAKHDPAEANRLYKQCLRAEGKYVSSEAFEMHLVSLIGALKTASPAVNSPKRVPRRVFEALGTSFASSFGPGVCFSSGVIIKDSRCASYTAFRLRWARRIQNIWVLAIYQGGASLRRHYHAVRRGPDGAYREVWWSNDLSGFSAWLSAGAVPMEKPRPPED